MFKIDFGRIANRLSSALDSFTPVGNGNMQTVGFQTLSFNPMSGKNAALDSLTQRLIEAQTELQEDRFAQQAQELIEKYKPKDVLLVDKFDARGLGAEIATLVPKNAKLGDAVFAELVPGDKADTARAMIDNLSDDTLKQMAETTNGRALLERTAVLLDGATTNQWDLRAYASSDSERKARIETALGNKPVEQEQQVEQKQSAPVTTVQQTENNGSYTSITEDQLRAIMLAKVGKNQKAEFEKNVPDYTRRINETMQRFRVNTPIKQAVFLATMRHESVGLSKLTEMPSKHASSKLREKGRGIIQLTLRSNYKAASEFFEWGKSTVQKDKNGKEIKVFTQWDLIDKPELAAEPDRAFPIAGWYWHANKINDVIGDAPRLDLLDIRHASAIVNAGKKSGDVISISDRLTGYKVALETLGVPVSDELRQNLDLAIKQNQLKERLRGREPIFVR